MSMLELLSVRQLQSYPVSSRSERRVAFALGGLGGANAHGAGFLHAAAETGIRPALISCTSGMIVWTAEYLRGRPLDELMKKAVESARPIPQPFDCLNRLRLLFAGMPNVFTPNIFSMATRLCTQSLWADTRKMLDLLLPIDVLKPTRPEAYYEEIAELFNASDIGIMFNTFNPETGVEYVHLNDAARALVSQMPHCESFTTCYRPITADYVRAGLWLMQYGMDRKFHGEVLIDGAYCRQFILRELVAARHVFVARPIRKACKESVPRNCLELEAFKTKMLFSGSYYGERHFVEWLNHQARQGERKGPYSHPVDLIEIEIDRNIGFFDFFMENRGIFDAAHEKSLAALRRWQEEEAQALQEEERESLCSFGATACA